MKNSQKYFAVRAPKPKIVVMPVKAAESENIKTPHGTQEPAGCRFIYGDPGIDPTGWRYCSRKIAPIGKTPAVGSNGVYCARHLKLVSASSS